MDLIERLSHDNPWLLVTPQECKREIMSLRQQLAECEQSLDSLRDDYVKDVNKLKKQLAETIDSNTVNATNAMQMANQLTLCREQLAECQSLVEVLNYPAG